jgi:hypothetical protein
MRLFALAAGFTLLMTACRDDAPSPSSSGSTSAPSKPGPTTAVTVRYDPGGKAKVDGAPLHGDPKTCAALKACCSASALSLFCALSQAKNEGDCAKCLKDVRAYADEAHVAPPAGCK